MTMAVLSAKTKSYTLDASPETVHWGFFDASLKPTLVVESGDTVTISTVSGRPVDLPSPESGFVVPPVLTEIHARVKQGPVGHILTGPVAIWGAKAGQVLEVRVKSVEINCDWGYNVIFPLAGGLPDDFEEMRVIHFPLYRDRMVARLPWGLEIPQAVLRHHGSGTAAHLAHCLLPSAAKEWRKHRQQRTCCRSTIYLPIQADGALFSVGDGHAAQGDGEVCSAIEAGLTGTFELHLRDDMQLDWPLAETATHVITMAFHPDLDNCVVMALRDMVKVICLRTGLSRRGEPLVFVASPPTSV